MTKLTKLTKKQRKEMEEIGGTWLFPSNMYGGEYGSKKWNGGDYETIEFGRNNPVWLSHEIAHHILSRIPGYKKSI